MNQQAMPSAPSLRTSAGGRVEDVHALDLHLQLATASVVPASRQNLDIRLAEDDEQVALTGVLQLLRHVEVGVHARLENRQPTGAVEL